MAEQREDREPEPAEETADRGIPSISRQGVGGGIGQKIILVVIVIVTLLALVAVNGGFSSEENQEDQSPSRSSSSTIGNHLGPPPSLPPPPRPPAAPKQKANDIAVIRTGQISSQVASEVAPPAPRYIASTNPRHSQKDEMTPEERKRTSGLLAFGNASSQSQANGLTSSRTQEAQDGVLFGNGGAEAERADGLGASLQATTLEGARAGLLVDRDLFITRGTFLNCALETAISSDVPGMTSCRLTRDVYSTSGNVLLLERGSRITGQYQGGLRRGQARIFVLWNRIETPTGVIVNLDSPGTDALGRSGHSGYIDTHFWERFGGAILLSLIDDFGTALANTTRSDNGDTIQFSSTSGAAQDAMATAVEDSINIPPTLNKNQGEHINIFVARDLDFRGVYELRAQ